MAEVLRVYLVVKIAIKYRLKIWAQVFWIRIYLHCLLLQDNEPLMRALTKLISVNAPDLVLFVGEALVGNEAIDQLVKFNAALADHSHQVERDSC